MVVGKLIYERGGWLVNNSGMSGKVYLCPSDNPLAYPYFWYQYWLSNGYNICVGSSTEVKKSSNG